MHYWDGSAPEGRQIRDISESGAYIYTPERWYLGTIIRDHSSGIPDVDGAGERQHGRAPASICVPARVVRQDPTELLSSSSFQTKQDATAFRTFLAANSGSAAESCASDCSVAREGQALDRVRLDHSAGLFLLAVNAVNFGGFIFAWITVANAARDGGAIYGDVQRFSRERHSGDSGADHPLVTSDVTSLMNRSSIVVAICTE